MPKPTFRVKLSFDKADKLWYADCLDLQGCHTFGETQAQALTNIGNVIADRIVLGTSHARDALVASSRGQVVEIEA